MRMKQVIVGTYEMGYEQVELVIREDTGGEFYVIPEKGSVPRIKIGADYSEWKDVVTTLLHEAFELVFDRLNCRYSPSNEITRDHSAYMFTFPHLVFSEACARVADFVTDALPDLAREWEKWKQSDNEEIKPELTA